MSCRQISTPGCRHGKSVYLYNVVCTATPQQLLDMQDAVQGVTQAAASAGASGHGKLDRSLKKLLLSVDAASSSDRLAIPVWVCPVANVLDCVDVGAMVLDLHNLHINSLWVTTALPEIIMLLRSNICSYHPVQQHSNVCMSGSPNAPPTNQGLPAIADDKG